MEWTRRRFCSTIVAEDLHASARGQVAPIGGRAIPQRANPETLPPPIGFSSIAPAIGRIFYVSGEVARTAGGDLAGPGDFGNQLRQVFRNLNTAAQKTGGAFEDIVRMNILCASNVPHSELPQILEVLDESSSHRASFARNGWSRSLP